MMKKIFVIWSCVILLGAIVSFAGQQEKSGQEVEIKEVESFWYAYMEFSGPFDNMEKNIQVFMGEFFKQGLVPAGPFMGVYYNNPRKVKPEELKWDIGFQVSSDVKVGPPLKKKEFTKKTAAVYLYIGPYEKMGAAYDKVFKYAEDNGYKILWPTYDKYLNNAMQVKPEELKTQVIVPLEKK
jgi:AraC family transcriptional regulator